MLAATPRHETGITGPHALLAVLGRLLVRIRAAPAAAVQRVRRVRPEHLIVAVMIAALGLFLLILWTGSTGVGRGGR
jgi:hypothetical protein